VRVVTPYRPGARQGGDRHRFDIPTGRHLDPDARCPRRLEACRAPASLGKNEKLFLEVTGDNPFDPETQVLGNPRDVRSRAYYIRPFGWPVIECFLGGEGAGMMADDGPEAGFAHACDELAVLFGSNVRHVVRPLVASGWSRIPHVGGVYSCALAGHAAAREVLAPASSSPARRRTIATSQLRTAARQRGARC
jgi:monoamine oxidase